MKQTINSPVIVGLTELKLIPNFNGVRGWKNSYSKLKKYHGKKWALEIYHSGNMGNTIDSVNENLKIAFGAPITIQKIKSKSISFQESGSPDYSYSFYALLDVERLAELEV